MMKTDANSDMLHTLPIFDLEHISADDFLELYRHEITQKALLSAAEEIQLAREIEAGLEAEAFLQNGTGSSEEIEQQRRLVVLGQQARESLAYANTRLVISIAKRYRGQGLDFLDLIQEGNAGLLIAINKFDYRRGNRFSTYATWWIRQCITRALANQGRAIRLPAHLTGVIRRLYLATRELEQQNGREPTAAELAAKLAMSPRDVHRLQQIARVPLHLEQPAGERIDGTVLGDFIEDTNTAQPTEVVAKIMLTEEVQSLLQELTPREAQIICMRYGLQGYVPHTLKEIGEIMNLSRERIRQLEKDVLNKLRQPRYANGLQPFLH